MNPSFNLWTDPWITVERRDGRHADLGLEQTLVQAPDLLALYDSSPLVIVGIHRLLTAIVQDIVAPQSKNDLRTVWRAGGFPQAGIQAFGERYAQRFDLFSEHEPFLQSVDLPRFPEKRDKTWEIATLFYELPTSTFVAHYQHGVSSDHIFCPACSARGLVTLPAFASSGGAGIKPSINGVPPIYVLPGGNTLFERLWASLILPQFQPTAASTTVDAVWWRHDPVVEYKAVVNEVSYLHSLTFPARRVRLHPIQMKEPCTRCGAESTWGVHTMVYQMGESRSDEAPFWQDPFAAYRMRDTEPKPIRPQEGKALWREFAGLFLPMTKEEGQKEHTLPPGVLYQRGNLTHDIGPDYALFPVYCVGLRTDMKAKIFEWLEAGFDVPTTLLQDMVASDVVRGSIEFASDCARTVASAFHKSFSREGSEQYGDVKNRMIQAYWAALASPFREFVNGVAARETRETARRTWVEKVVDVGKQTFKEASESVGGHADTLRKRVEGQALCGAWLNKKRKDTFGETEEAIK